MIKPNKLPIILEFSDYIELYGLPTNAQNNEQTKERIERWINQATTQFDNLVSPKGTFGVIYSFWSNLEDNDQDNLKGYKLQQVIGSWVETFIQTGKFWVDSVPSINSNMSIDISTSSSNSDVELKRIDIIQALVSLGLYQDTNLVSSEDGSITEQEKLDLKEWLVNYVELNFLRLIPQAPLSGPLNLVGNDINNTGSINGTGTYPSLSTLSNYRLTRNIIDFKENEITNLEVNVAQKANTILDPLDNTYKSINQFNANYFNGYTKEQVDFRIAASGMIYNPTFTYAKDFIVRFSTTQNKLKWARSLIDNNVGNVPPNNGENAFWYVYETEAIDIAIVLEQIKPFITQELAREIPLEVSKQLNALPTIENIIYKKNGIYDFANEEEFNIVKQELNILDSDYEVLPNGIYGVGPVGNGIVSENNIQKVERINNINGNIIIQSRTISNYGGTNKTAFLQEMYGNGDFSVTSRADTTNNYYWDSSTMNPRLSGNDTPNEPSEFTYTINKNLPYYFGVDTPTPLLPQNATIKVKFLKDIVQKGVIKVSLDNYYNKQEIDEKTNAIDTRLNIQNENITNLNNELNKVVVNSNQNKVDINDLKLNLSTNYYNKQEIDLKEKNLEELSNVNTEKILLLENTTAKLNVSNLGQFIIGDKAKNNILFDSFNYLGKDYSSIKTRNGTKNYIQFETNISDNISTINAPNGDFYIETKNLPTKDTHLTNKAYVDSRIINEVIFYDGEIKHFSTITKFNVFKNKYGLIENADFVFVNSGYGLVSNPASNGGYVGDNKLDINNIPLINIPTPSINGSFIIQSKGLWVNTIKRPFLQEISATGDIRLSQRTDTTGIFDFNPDPVELGNSTTSGDNEFTFSISKKLSVNVGMNEPSEISLKGKSTVIIEFIREVKKYV